MPSSVLVIEDEPAIADTLIYALEQEGFNVHWSPTGESALQSIKESSPDIILLDIGLHNIGVVGNKIRNQSDEEFLISNLPSYEFLGFIPYDQALVEADHANLSILGSSLQITAAVKDIYQSLLSTAGAPSIN